MDTPQTAMTTRAPAVLIMIMCKDNTHLGVEGAVKGSEDVPGGVY